MKQLKTGAKISTGYLLTIMVFLLPVSAKLSTIFIILTIVSALFVTDWKNFFSDLKQNIFFLISISYFSLHVIAILYSSNLHYAFKDVQTKLSFLVFPLIFTMYKPLRGPTEIYKKSFIAGCIVALLIDLIKSLIHYSTSQDTHVFFYTDFSGLMHPTYFGIYINLAIIFLLEDAYSDQKPKDFNSIISFFVSELFLLTGLVLLSARMSLFVTVITVLIFAIIKTIQNKNHRKFSVALFISFIITGGIQYETTTIFNRFTQIETSIQHETDVTVAIKDNKASTEEYNSTTSRIALWKYAAELIASSPGNFLFGTGTGDIKDELIKVYQKNNFQKGITENYNPHNQFLHTTVVIGIIGLSILLLQLIYPMITSLKRNFITLTAFIAIVFFNSLTESILEVQSGIIFFCFFYCLLNAEMKAYYPLIKK